MFETNNLIRIQLGLDLNSNHTRLNSALSQIGAYASTPEAGHGYGRLSRVGFNGYIIDCY